MVFNFSFFIKFLIEFLFSFFIVGLSFFVHELAHKIAAKKFRLDAEYQSNKEMLFFGLITSFFGFVFLSPGGVFIRGNISNKKNLFISLAGPLTNLFIAASFIFALTILSFFNVFFVYFSSIILFIISMIKINSFLAFFNFLPISGFDGYQIFKINKKVYFSFFIFSLIIWFYTIIVY
ncbi:MAG: site-2 protease family protein [Candidatus Woesearchaeota archaeon]